MRPDQAIDKIGAAVFPDKQRLRDTGFIFEPHFRTVEQPGNYADDFSFVQAVAAA